MTLPIAPIHAKDMVLHLENSVRTIKLAETGLLTEHGLNSAIAAAQRLKHCAAAMETELRRQRRQKREADAKAGREAKAAERRNAAILRQRECMA